jgi:hypothetical protein
MDQSALLDLLAALKDTDVTDRIRLHTPLTRTTSRCR